MSSFLGTDTYAIDHKGRIAIPLALRRGDGRKKPIDRFVLAAGFEGCLALYSLDEWTRVEDRLRRIPMGGRKGRAFQRAFLMDVVKVSVDSQGRITIPPALMSRAGLSKEAVLHGVLNRIEIWNPERLEVELRDGQQQLEALAEDVLKEE
jgi:MraZ protein